MRTYGPKYTAAERRWCEAYEAETTFEPLMCDFETGNQTFVEAANFSVKWFKDWSNDVYLKISAAIPGELNHG